MIERSANLLRLEYSYRALVFLKRRNSCGFCEVFFLGVFFCDSSQVEYKQYYNAYQHGDVDYGNLERYTRGLSLQRKIVHVHIELMNCESLFSRIIYLSFYRDFLLQQCVCGFFGFGLVSEVVDYA